MEMSTHVPFEYFAPHFSIQSFPFILDGLNSSMNYIYDDWVDRLNSSMNFIYPDRVNGSNSSINYIHTDMDLVPSIDNNLRHGNTKKYKKFKKQANKVKKEWSGNTATSYSGMCDIIGKYQILAISKL